MGSKKLDGDNIEYIENSDSHPGAQFNSEFRDLAKSEIAKFAAEDRPGDLAQQGDLAADGDRQIAQGEILDLPKPAAPERVAQEPPQAERRE
jgi:hypothetical protein